MSVRPIVRRGLAVIMSLAVAITAIVAFATPASAASPKRCGKTGYERVFTLNPTKGNDFVIKTYRKPPKDDPKSTAPRCVILWANKAGKGKLNVNGWSKSKQLKKGQRIEKLVGPKGMVDVSGTHKRPKKPTTRVLLTGLWF